MAEARRIALAAMALAAVACGKTSPEPPIAWYARIAPACAAAKRLDRPLLFINWASWDALSAEFDKTIVESEPLRKAVRHDWVTLRVDRSDVYMQEGSGSAQEREVDEAQRRFKPWESKYATIVLMAPDCTTEIGRIDRDDSAPQLVEQLAAAKRKLRR
jgi:hypothetical protein